MPRFVPVSEVSYDSWLQLWLDYTAGQIPVDSGLHAVTFDRLRTARQLHGLVAVDAEPIGLVHYYFHPSTWAVTNPCYIQDLFVAPRARGQNLGRQLIDAVAEQARAAGSHVLHWNTRAGNHAAHALYEKFAERSDRVTYLQPL